MKNLNKYIAITMLAVAGFFMSCEGILDIPQQGVQPIEDFYKTDDQAVSALADLYTQWRSAYSGMFYPLNNMSDDCFAGWANEGDNGGAAHAFNTFTFDETRTADFYGAASGAGPSGIVRRANTILARVEPDTPVKRRVLAECHVARAWAYSYLNQMFGGVPLFEEEITAQNAEAPRATAAEVWDLVNRDFEKAINSGDLPSKSAVGDKENILRVTKEAAQAWYGKALLWQGKWAESATQLKAVINSGKYQLIAADQLKNHRGEPDFGYVIRRANNLSTEAVFEFNSKPDQNGNAGGEAYGGIMGAWRADQLTYNGGLFNYVPELDYAGGGWGGTGVARKGVYDAFVEMEGPDGFRLKGSIMTWADFQALGIGIAGVYFSSEGFWDYKIRLLRHEAGSWMQGTGWELYAMFNTWKPMRYAEVLLNAAEACLRSGDAASALTYINTVRERAKLAPLISATLTDMKKEKRLELYREGVRYIDLVRWEVLGDNDGITASQALGQQGRTIPAFDGVAVNPNAYTYTRFGWKKGKHELLPIPLSELNANRYIVQNPGW